MRKTVYFFLLFLRSLAISADFDCVVVGTSPIPLFEALYKHACGQKVLILEAAAECGGAWKSIDICGIKHVDMGCHEIGSTPELNRFLEEYAGCRLITSKNRPYYFSQGCFELIDHLLKRIEKENIPLRTNCRVDSVTVDLAKKTAWLYTNQGTFSASKIVVTPGSSFSVNSSKMQARRNGHEFYHLYFLIQDPTPPRFTYHGGISSGVSRMMNLTSCVGLENSGRQLIVFQTYTQQQLEHHDSFLGDLKRAGLIDQSAYLLTSDSYIYEQGPYFQLTLLSPEQQGFFELLNTSHFNVIARYAAKWKTILKPYSEY